MSAGAMLPNSYVIGLSAFFTAPTQPNLSL